MEKQAMHLLLDVGVAVPLRTPRLLKKKGRGWKVVIRTPTLGKLMLIAKKYTEMGVKYEEVKAYDFEQNLEFYAKHGKALSEMVALSLRGGHRFNAPVAWFLRWMVHPVMLQEAWFQMLTLLDTRSFQHIIRSAEMINPTTPRLSHTGKGS